jgi:hypothetical protein
MSSSSHRANTYPRAHRECVSPNLNILAQAYVHGDSIQTFLVAIFGVQPDTFAPFASKILGKTISTTDLHAIRAACLDPRIRKAVVKELDRVGKKTRSPVTRGCEIAICISSHSPSKMNYSPRRKWDPLLGSYTLACYHCFASYWQSPD